MFFFSPPPLALLRAAASSHRSAMAAQGSSSSSTIRRRVHPEIPLITYPDCRRYTVLERVVKTGENGNKGLVFYRCPGGKVVIGVGFLSI
jgi:hypothetical protein